MHHTRRAFLASTLAAPALLTRASAQAWPDKPIRVVIPFGAGSSVDIIGRIITEYLSRALGQSMVIENRGGAGGAIGSREVSLAAPDGYTLLINASAHSAAPAAYPQIQYDPVKDFASVASFGVIPNVVIVRAGRGINTIADFLKEAKAGNFTFASAGVGSATHWAAERLRLAGGFAATHVPFRSGPEAINEVMAGRVDFASMGMSSALPFINDGKIIGLAVSTTKRSAALPNAPTTLEAGLPDSDYTYWNGLFAPAKTPRAIVDRLHAEVQKVLALPDVVAKFNPQGVEPMPVTPQEFDAVIAKEVAANIALVKAAGLKFE
jgi:tripartite-type tricarboxylate transporter receptor subunit TctC